MLKTILTILGILTVLLIALISYAACIAASREDRVMERLYEKWAMEHSNQEQTAAIEEG